MESLYVSVTGYSTSPQLCCYRIQIMQECWEYDLTTTSVKLIQQTTSSSVCS